MTEETGSIVLEMPERLRGKMMAPRPHVAAFMTNGLTQESDIAAIKLRLDRIERRLDPTD